MSNPEQTSSASNEQATIRGQVLGVRNSKDLAFIDVGLPGDPTTQVVVAGAEKDLLPNIGDVYGANGELGETEVSKRRGLGQISLFATPEDAQIYATSERQRWPGADNRERHANQAEYIQTLRRRHTMQRGLREHLDEAGYIHVDTSILQDTPSGAAARTFDTVTNFDGRERHLRIAPEIDLKVIMALSGLERVYEIGRNFRNEGTGPMHHPEFTNLEAYTAYQGREEAGQMTKSLLSSITDALGTNHDFTSMPSMELAELFSGVGIDIEKDILDRIEQQDLEAMQMLAAKFGIDASDKGYAGIVDSLIKTSIRPKLIKPTLIHGYLSDQMPLAASLGSDNRIADAFQVIVDGAEIVKAYQEEVNPVILRQKLERQAGESEDDAFRTDQRLVIACKMGLPPMFGIGIGLDRMTAVLGKKTVASVIPMPINWQP